MSSGLREQREARPVTADPNEMAADAGQADPFAVEKEALPATEPERLRALQAADMAVAERLHANGYQLIPLWGVAVSKREYLDPIASREFINRVFVPISSMVVRVSDQMSGEHCRARIKVRVTSGATDSGTFWHTDINEMHDGRWQTVWSQGNTYPAR